MGLESNKTVIRRCYEELFEHWRLAVHGGNSAAALLEPLLAQVAAGFRVYAPDRPGCGLTDPFGYRGVDLRRLKPSAATVRESYRGRLVADVSRVPREHLDLALAAATMPGARRAWLTMVRAATRRLGTSPLTYALRPELAGLSTPTLFVWGEQDRLGSPGLGREMAALMPDARAEVVPDAGHLPWLDRPERVAELVTGFLREDDRKAPR